MARSSTIARNKAKQGAISAAMDAGALMMRSLHQLLDMQFSDYSLDEGQCPSCGIASYRAYDSEASSRNVRDGRYDALDGGLVYNHYDSCKLAQLIADIRKHLRSMSVS